MSRRRSNFFLQDFVGRLTVLYDIGSGRKTLDRSRGCTVLTRLVSTHELAIDAVNEGGLGRCTLRSNDASHILIHFAKSELLHVRERIGHRTIRSSNNKIAFAIGYDGLLAEGNLKYATRLLVNEKCCFSP